MKISRRGLLKTGAVLCLIITVGLGALAYGISSVGKGIFLSAQGQDGATLGQFTEMIIQPAASLKGEADGRINLLLLGVGGDGHDGGALTDTIIIMSLKPHTKETAMISIPRDLYVEVEDTNIRGKINAVKVQGDTALGGRGSELLRQEVEKISGLPIHYYAQLDFEGFTKAVDVVGGIDVYLSKAINDPLYPNFTHGYDPFQISAGWHHLDGATALKVVRSRHDSSDFDRSARQQEVVKAFRQKVFEKYRNWDVVTLGNLFASFSGNLQTDVEPRELPRFYQIFKEMKSQNFKTESVNLADYLQKVKKGYGYTLGLSEDKIEAAQERSRNVFEEKLTPQQQNDILIEGARVEIRSYSQDSGAANQAAEDLEKLGVRVVRSANAPNRAETEKVTTGIYTTTQNSFPVTQNFLSRALMAPVTPESPEPFNADFLVVLGENF